MQTDKRILELCLQFLYFIKHGLLSASLINLGSAGRQCYKVRQTITFSCFARETALNTAIYFAFISVMDMVMFFF
jgi:hypothetical protein